MVLYGSGGGRSTDIPLNGLSILALITNIPTEQCGSSPTLNPISPARHIWLDVGLQRPPSPSFRGRMEREWGTRGYKRGLGLKNYLYGIRLKSSVRGRTWMTCGITIALTGRVEEARQETARWGIAPTDAATPNDLSAPLDARCQPRLSSEPCCHALPSFHPPSRR